MLSLASLFGEDAPILQEKDFQILLVANLPSALGTSLVSPVLDSLIGPFNTSAANIGLLISSFTAPAIVLIPLIGVLADHYGRKPIIVSSLLLFGLAGTAIAFTTDFGVVLALRVIQGVGFAGLTPVIITSIGDLYNGEKEATGQGLRFTVSGFSGAIFPIIGGLVVGLAWQYPFLLYTITIPIAMIVYLWMEEPNALDPSTTPDGGEIISYARLLFRLIRQRRVLAILVARAMYSGIFIGFLTYNSLIVVRLIGRTPAQAGMLAAVVYFSFALVGSQAGRITGLFKSRFAPLISANICLGSGFIIVLFAPSLKVATVGVTLIGVGVGLTGTLYRSIITSLAPHQLRAGLVSLGEAGGRLTQTLTPLAMGGVIGATAPVIGFTSALKLAGTGLAIVAAGGGIICLFIVRSSPPALGESLETTDA